MTTATLAQPRRDSSLLRRFVGVVAEPQSYRNLAYLLLGLPLGTLWFTLIVTGLSVSISMLVVALLGIPMLWAMWYAIRAFGNVERATSRLMLGVELRPAPMSSSAGGNVWRRLRVISGERDRWRELGYLMLRFPAGLATFTAAVTALTVPLTIAYAPFYARYVGDHSFGDWSQSERIDEISSGSPWSWLLVPLGLILLLVAFHAMNALARTCGRWAESWLARR